MSRNRLNRTVLVLLGTSLLGGGCADFDKEVLSYCARNVVTCDGDSRSSFLPIRDISTRGYHTLALRADGVLSWGLNESGQLGHGTPGGDILEPTLVSGLTGSERVAAGYTFSLAQRGGKVFFWGSMGPEVSQNSPSEVSGLPSISEISAGYDHAVVLDFNNAVWAWGPTSAGQNSKTPVLMSSLKGIVKISSGNSHSLALDNQGHVWAWGDNSTFQLGSEAPGGATPVRVNGLEDIGAIAAGGFHSLALDGKGQVWAWGNNDNGQLGNGTVGGKRAKPMVVTGLEKIKFIAAGYAHSLAVDDGNNVLAWGDGSRGQLGDGLKEDRSSPVEAHSLSDVKAISAGHIHSVALTSGGYLSTWGGNSHGQLGRDGTSDATKPTLVNVPVP